MAYLPECILVPPAMFALKALQACCLASAGFESETLKRDLDFDGKVLLDICQALRRRRYHRDDISFLNRNVLLEEHVRNMAEKLTHDILFKLALLTWHFDASAKLPSRELFLFFDQPNGKCPELYKDLYVRYCSQTGKSVSYRQFSQDFGFMLGMLEFLFLNEWNLIWQCSS